MSDRVVATVNGTPIDERALQAAMRNLAGENPQASLDKAPWVEPAALRAMALEQLIARELIFQAAMAEGLVADDAAVGEESARLLGLMGTPVDFWKRLADRGMDRAAFFRMVRKDLTVANMTARKLENVAEPGEAEIREFFATHPEQLRAADRAIPGPPTLDEARPRIIGFLKRARGARLLQEWVAELRRQAKITIGDD